MIIHLHCFSWNDAQLLPHFFQHHEGWVDHFHFWDLSSTDGTLQLLGSHPRVTVHSYEVEGASLVNTQRQRFNDVWRISRGTADWVLLLSADEQLHHPELRDYLQRRTDDGVTAIKAIGYEMLSNRAPSEFDTGRALSEQLTQGCRSPGLDRLVAISPSAVTATNFAPGQHHAWPEGHVVWPASSELLLLRFQMLSPEYYVEVCRQRAAALLAEDRAQGWAAHLGWSEGALREHQGSLLARAKTVPGLGELAYLAPEDFRRDERKVEMSGLFDTDWYESRYPDIAAQHFDPLTHFCEYGWREGRAPNPYFDIAWYASQHPVEIAEGLNPLVHYIEHGEPRDIPPSSHFDPGWYRRAYGLGGEQSPLRHYLQHRFSGMVSPLPDFDVEAYVAAHPQLREHGRDPYLHRQASPAQESAPLEDRAAPAYPRWADILLSLGGHESGNDAAGQVPMVAVEAAIRAFLFWLPFDERWYLRAYPDVAEAIAEGVFASGHAHFIQHGYFEGRTPTPGLELPD